MDCGAAEELAAALRFILPESVRLRCILRLNRLLARMSRFRLPAG